MNKQMTPVKFKELVQAVYDETEKRAGQLLPIRTASEYTNEDYFSKKRYKGVRVRMYDQRGIRVDVDYSNGHTHVGVSDGNSLHSWRNWEVGELKDLSLVLAAAATILEKAMGE